MNRRHLQTFILLALALAPAPFAVAQTATTSAPPTAKAASAFGDDTPGVGPIRTEPAFVKLWNDRRAHFREKKAKQHGGVVFFGDSITQGWGDNFRDLFKDSGLKLANRGISGDTTRGLIARVDEDVLSLEPSAIVLLIGTNDLAKGVSPSDIAGNMKILLGKIAKHDAKVPVVLCLVMPASGEKQRRPAEKIREINELYTELVKQNPQVTTLDLYTLFANDQGDAKPEEFPDLLHPNDAGYKKWREALWPVFVKLGLVDAKADAAKP